jgi:hypothetical protein
MFPLQMLLATFRPSRCEYFVTNTYAEPLGGPLFHTMVSGVYFTHIEQLFVHLLVVIILYYIILLYYYYIIIVLLYYTKYIYYISTYKYNLAKDS